MSRNKVFPSEADSGRLVARFAPSPTGISHAGNIYAYLLTWLLTKSQGGEVVLRIEDLDSSRSKQEYADALLKMFEETGLVYDRGPYYQSDNTARYMEAFEEFRRQGLTYPCFCTRKDLSFQSAPHASDGIRVYDRRCLRLSEEDICEKGRELAKEGRLPSYRILTDSRIIEFDDAICGPRSFKLDADCGDFVIKRADADFAYNLAVVMDDIGEGVNIITRGNDLLGTTPQQIYLYELLKEEIPAYAHFPMLCAEDGRRLAKRDSDATYDALKDAYESPQGVIGHIAHITGIQDEDMACTPQDLLNAFDSTRALQACSETSSITYY